MEEARALEGTGRYHLLNKHPEQAAEPLSQALAIYEKIGSSNAQRVTDSMRHHGIL